MTRVGFGMAVRSLALPSCPAQHRCSNCAASACLLASFLLGAGTAIFEFPGGTELKDAFKAAMDDAGRQLSEEEVQQVGVLRSQQQRNSAVLVCWWGAVQYSAGILMVLTAARLGGLLALPSMACLPPCPPARSICPLFVGTAGA